MQSGTQLGHYGILSPLGKGGMGEVWKAKDTKLGREVAIKTLPEEFAKDEERLARFEREAKLLASLNHPNIAAIYGLEEHEGTRFLVLELVEGDTLAERLKRGAIPVEESLKLALQIAEALEAAHDKGVIHRDLKPANIKVTPDGKVKVLDFGLAKLTAHDSLIGSQQETILALTQTGTMLGTVAYMSPEQVRCQEADERSDMFSLGVVLYEMVAGRNPFLRGSPMETGSAILNHEPPGLPKGGELELPQLSARMLTKALDGRYQSMRDLRTDLEALRTPVKRRIAADWRLVVSLAAATAVLVVVVLWFDAFTSDPEVQPTRTPFQAATFSQLTSEGGQEVMPSLSPDGTMIAYQAVNPSGPSNTDIYVRRVGGENPINLTADSAEPDRYPAFSPEGDRIAFSSARSGDYGIWVMGATGESARRLTDFGHAPSWSADGTQLVVATQPVSQGNFHPTADSELWVVDVESGDSFQIAAGDAMQPDWSPKGHRVAFWSIGGYGDQPEGQRDIWTVRADGSDPVSVTDDFHVDWSPVWSPDGRHLYFSSDRGGSMNLWRVPIDEETGRILADPEPITSGGSGFRHSLSVSADGRSLAYVDEGGGQDLLRVGLDPSTYQALGDPVVITPGSRNFFGASVSPDGQWLAVTSARRQEDVYVMRVDGTNLRQLTDDPYKDRQSKWSPVASRIAFRSNRSGNYEIWAIDADGSDLTQLTDTQASVGSISWSSDGTEIGFRLDREGNATYNIIDAGKSWEEQVTRSVDLTGPLAGFYPSALSPTDNVVAGLDINEGRIAILSLESNELTHLSYSGCYGAGPQWLNGGQRLVLPDCANQGLYVMDIQTGDVQHVLSVSPPAILRSHAVSLDNRQLFYRTLTEEADIWLIELPDEPQ